MLRLMICVILEKLKILNKVKTISRRQIIRFVIGIIFIMIWFVSSDIEQRWSSYVGPVEIIHNEFPISGTNGVASDKSGNIYCGTSYSIIQKYDSKGKFMEGYHFDAGLGAYVFTIENEQIIVVPVRSDRVVILTTGGEMIKEAQRPWMLKEIENKNNSFNDGKSTYNVRQLFGVFPYIKRVNEDGTSEIVVRAHLFQWLFTNALATLLFFLGGIYLVAPNGVKNIFREIKDKWDNL